MERLQTWKDKLLHGQFLRETEEQICVNHSGSGYILYGNLTEGLVLAAQEQALSTNAIGATSNLQPSVDFVAH